MIFHAFDTHNRMPQMRWDWAVSAQGKEILPKARTNLAELGSLTVEFTRLSQLTGNPKYYDAVQRITDELDRSQMVTKIPGLWPLVVDADKLDFSGSEFSLGGCADSTYEYLPKEHILLGAQTDQYRNMYTRAMESIKKNLLFRAMTQDEDRQILFTSNARAVKGGYPRIKHISEHLKCFLGGTVGIAAKIFNRTEDLSIARGLTDGCIWAYDQMPTGIMPEMFKFTACENMHECPWDERHWHDSVYQQPVRSKHQLEHVQGIITSQGLPPGMVELQDLSYKLR